MSDNHAQLAELAEPMLVLGEQVLSSVQVNYNGKVNRMQPPKGIAALGGPSSIVAGEELVERMGNFPDVEFPSAKQMALVLTGGRILIWSRGGLKGKPKDFLGEVPLGAVERVTFEASRLGDLMMIGLVTGWEINLESPRGAGGEQFGAALMNLVESDAS